MHAYMVVYIHLNLFTLTLQITTDITTGISTEKQSQTSTVITTAVASSLLVFILSSVLIFIIGCVCGWFGHKHKAKRLEKDNHSQPTSAPGPVYEDLQPSMSMQGDPREKTTFELKENVAYGPVQLT